MDHFVWLRSMRRKSAAKSNWVTRQDAVETDRDGSSKSEHSFLDQMEGLLTVYRAIHSEIDADATNILTYIPGDPAPPSERPEEREARSSRLLNHLASLPDDFTAQRRIMIDRLRHEITALDAGIDLRQMNSVLHAIASIPRERFFRYGVHVSAYLPTAVDIGHGQTISHPYLVALMTIAADLHPAASVLDVGTGSGYQAAVLSRLTRHVTTIEIVDALTARARSALAAPGFGNVESVSGDGSYGWLPNAPYDAILVAASSATLPPALLAQLKPTGRIIMPLGPADDVKQLVVATKSAATEDVVLTSLGPVHFVPFTGAHGREGKSNASLDCSGLPYTYGRPVTHA